MARKKKTEVDKKLASLKMREGSQNDFYIGEPEEWWVAFNREYNSYYHLPCREEWENKLVVLDPKYREPQCPHCDEKLSEQIVMLLLLQRMKVTLPGQTVGGD